MLQLRIEHGGAAAPTFILRTGEYVVGRSHGAHWQLQDKAVSSRQMRIVVQGEIVELENLSQFGTVVDDQPVQGKVRLSVGQRIRVGQATTIILEAVDSGAEPGGQKTGAAVLTAPMGTRSASVSALTTKPPLAGTATGVAGTSASVTGDPLDHGAQFTDSGVPAPAPRGGASTAGSSRGSHDATRAMMTRPAGADEIEYLRLREQKKARWRFYLLGGVIIFVLVLIWVLRPRIMVDVPEWSERDYVDATNAVPLGELSLIYPQPVGVTCKAAAVPGGLRVTLPLGRRRDVPLHLTYWEDVNDSWATMDAAQAIQTWSSLAGQKEGRWTFEKPASYFMGAENGVQFWAVSYHRQQDRLWRGMASLFRQGRRCVVVRAEIPLSDQARAEHFLYYIYVSLPANFLRMHWEGRANLPAGEVPDLLQQCRADLAREAPATWAALEEQLSAALAKAVAEHRPADEKEGLALLVRLREKMNQWFNTQQLRHDQAQRAGEASEMRKVAAECQVVFKSPNDRRYFTVRNWQQ
jgi:hypothetical protein